MIFCVDLQIHEVEILTIQLFTVGIQVAILGLPGSGRRCACIYRSKMHTS